MVYNNFTETHPNKQKYDLTPPWCKAKEMGNWRKLGESIQEGWKREEFQSSDRGDKEKKFLDEEETLKIRADLEDQEVELCCSKGEEDILSVKKFGRNIFFQNEKFKIQGNRIKENFTSDFISKKKKSKWEENIMILFLLIFQVNADITFLAPKENRFFFLSFNVNQLTTDSIFQKSISKKIPQLGKVYMTYQVGKINSVTTNFIRIVNFAGENSFPIEDFNHFFLYYEFTGFDTTQFVFHIQEESTSPSKLGFGILKDININFNFTIQIDDYPYDVEERKKTFAYSKVSNFLIFSKKSSSTTHQITAGDIQEENTWRVYPSTVESETSLEYFLINPKKPHSTQFVVLNINQTNFLTFYDYSQSPITRTKSIKMTDILSINQDQVQGIQIVTSPSAEESSYLSFVHHQGNFNPIKFSDINLKSPENPRTIEIANLNDSEYKVDLFGIKSTNLFMIKFLKFDSDQTKFIHHFYIVDNHNGESDIEVKKLDENYFQSFGLWRYERTFFRISQLSNDGDILIHGREGSVHSDSGGESLFSTLIINVKCHPSCEDSKCSSPNLYIACYECLEPTKMSKTIIFQSDNKPNTYRCLCKTRYLDISSETCSYSCRNNQVELPGDPFVYCMTDDECKERSLYPTVQNYWMKACVDWQTCASTEGSYYDIMNDSCEMSSNNKMILYYYNLVDSSIRMTLLIDESYCDLIKGLKINSEACPNCCLKCGFNARFFLLSKAFCLSQAQCNRQSTETTTYLASEKSNIYECITKEKCYEDGGNYLYSGKCIYSDCPEDERILNPAGTICYSKSNCDDDEGKNPQTYLIEVDSSNNFLCVTKQECIDDPRFLFNINKEKCQKKSDCKILEGEVGLCVTRCIDGRIYYLNEDNTCYSEVTCESKPDRVVDNISNECLTKSQCKKKGFYLHQEKNCVKFCPTKFKFKKNQECYERCPNEGEFGQRNTDECVAEEKCESIQLENGSFLEGKGNPDTGECVLKNKNTKPNIMNDDYLIDEKTGFAKAMFNPRTEIQGLNSPGSIYLPLPLDISIFKVEDRTKVVSSIEFELSRRILQTQDPKFEIFILNNGQKYIRFEAPTEEEFKVKINFDTETEFETQLEDETIAISRIEVPYVTFLVPKKQINRPTPKEPTKYPGVFTFIYDIYSRIISPFFGAHFQFILSQNYQRMNLLSHLEFWKMDETDSTYVYAFKDWISEIGKYLAGDDVVNKEVDKNCENDRERHCAYKKNFILIPAGIGGLILLMIFLLALLIEIYFKSKSKGKKQKLFFDKIFVRFLIGMQTNLIFYTISSLKEISVSSFLSGFILLLTLTMLVLSLKKGTKMNSLLSETFKETPYMKILFFAGVVYDFAFSIIIVFLSSDPKRQSMVLFVFEIFYTFVIFETILADSENKLIGGFFFGLGMISLIKIWITLMSLSIFSNKLKMQNIILVLSFTSTFLSAVLILVDLLISKKKKENSPKPMSKKYVYDFRIR